MLHIFPEQNCLGERRWRQLMPEIPYPTTI
jgi:hypothetical protein